jgi:SAM-dependent methyltransferase
MRTATPEFYAFITDLLAGRPGPLRILEVGGGANTRLPLTDAHVTVLDNSADALARNTYAEEKLFGDAQTTDLGRDRFDVAVFWNVLEHLARPQAALARACDALKPGGLLIVRGPELRSLKALVTRATPHRFHVLFYRRVLGIAEAGTNGRSPFPTPHSRGAGRPQIADALVERGFRIRYESAFVGDQVVKLRRYSPLGYRAYAGAAKLMRVATRGRYGARETDFVLVAERPATTIAPAVR